MGTLLICRRVNRCCSFCSSARLLGELEEVASQSRLEAVGCRGRGRHGSFHLFDDINQQADRVQVCPHRDGIAIVILSRKKPSSQRCLQLTLHHALDGTSSKIRVVPEARGRGRYAACEHGTRERRARACVKTRWRLTRGLQSRQVRCRRPASGRGGGGGDLAFARRRVRGGVPAAPPAECCALSAAPPAGQSEARLRYHLLGAWGRGTIDAF